jgi:hypothetical protein
MPDNNNKEPAERKVKLGVEFSFEKSSVVFSEDEVNGIAMVKPNTIHVPMTVIMLCAAEIIIKTSTVKVNPQAQVQQRPPGMKS